MTEILSKKTNQKRIDFILKRLLSDSKTCFGEGNPIFKASLAEQFNVKVISL